MSESGTSVPRLLSESVLSTGCAIGAATLAQPWLSLPNLAFLFLAPVIFVAGRRGLTGGLATAIMATLGFNFFFIPPAYTLQVADLDNLVTLLVLALAALFVSQFAARLKAQAIQAENLARTSDRLAVFVQDLAVCADEHAVRSLAIERIEAWTGAALSFVDPDQDKSLSPLDAAAARWAIAHKVESGRGTGVMAGADALYWPIDENSAPIVAQFWRGTGAAPIPQDCRDVVKQALRYTASALHRVIVDARLQHDAMREAVLASIGHDLRTPLTGVIAGLAALPSDPDGLVESTRAEAARLEHLVSNILDLARLRSDALPAPREAIDLTDAVDAVLCALANRLAAHRMIVDISPDLPLVRSDAPMLHHMLLNLVDNAVKFSRPGSCIVIEGRVVQAGASLVITDEGRGLVEPGIGLPKRNPTEAMAGSGLGLTVVSGFATALGITFGATNRTDGNSGASMSLGFPSPLCINPAKASA